MNEQPLSSMPELRIEKLDNRGRGIATFGELPVLCDGTLPGELVQIDHCEPHRRGLMATSYAIVRPVEARITPLCRYYGECGGCQLQQARYDAQVSYKESQLRQYLEQYGNVHPDQWLVSLTNAAFHYRRRVRLGVRMLDHAKVTIGFHRKHHSYLLDIQACPVLDPRLQSLLAPLHQLVVQLSVRQRLPQIEMSCGEQEVALVFRHLMPLQQHDRDLLQEFARVQQVLVFTQAQGPESNQPLISNQVTRLQYQFPRHQVRLTHAPTDFVQANAPINEKLVDAVIDYLDVQRHDVVLDLYSGIGNFSLPLARYAGSVIGIEGHPALVARARDNANRNGLRNVEFRQADLSNWTPDVDYNKVVVDPPREGAIDVIKQLSSGVETIVYVSCMPRTLARDARYLVHHCGYRLTKAGLVDMFPQTKHIEAIAVFQRG